MQSTILRGVATWTLDRPESGNGLDEATLTAMAAALEKIELYPGPLNCLLIRGQSTVFSTGLDEALLKACFSDRIRFTATIDVLNRLLDRIEALPCVTIAAISGECRLGGLELALACDLVVAADDARIADGHLAYDAMPGGGATRRLPARIGYHQALRFVLTGETWDGTTAAAHGLVDEVVASDQLAARSEALARTLAAATAEVVKGVKASMRAVRPISTDRSEREWFTRAVIDRLVPL